MIKIVKNIFLKLMLNIDLHNIHNDLPFLPVRMKSKKLKNL